MNRRTIYGQDIKRLKWDGNKPSITILKALFKEQNSVKGYKVVPRIL